jgi:hypothetical protein
MAAVIAAIAAGFLAGIVALFREHRIQERHLLVAARGMDEALSTAETGIRVSLESNGWAPLNLLPTPESFGASWDSFRADLAGHLDWNEWDPLAHAVANYMALNSMTQEDSPQSEDVSPRLRHTIEKIEVARKQITPYRTKRFSLWRQLQRRRAQGDWSTAARPSEQNG